MVDLKKKNLASRSLVYFILSFDVDHFKVFIELITTVLLLMSFFFLSEGFLASRHVGS